MKLMYLATQNEVTPGDIVFKDGTTWVIADPIGEPPHKPSSTGRIYVRDPEEQNIPVTQSYFPSVFDCKWVNEIPAKEPKPEPEPPVYHKYLAAADMDSRAYVVIHAIDWEDANELASSMNLPFVELVIEQ